MSTMTRKEWVAACADRIMKTAGTSKFIAVILADDLADRETDKHGASGLAWMSPADAADNAEEGGSE